METINIEELLRNTIDSSMDMIQVFHAVRDGNNEIVDFVWILNNQASKAIYGDVIGKSLLALNPGVIEEGVFETFKQVVQTGVAQQYEKYYSHEQFHGWFHQSVAKLNDGVTTTTSDITGRKKAEQEILRLKEEIAQKARDKYETLFKTVDEGISVLELIYDDENRPVDICWLEANPAFERMTGLKDLAGKLASDLMPPELSSLANYDSVLKTGESVSSEIYHADTRQWFRTHISRVGGAGSRVVANLFYDITDRKQQQRHQEFLLNLSDALRTDAGADAVATGALQLLMDHVQLDRMYGAATDGHYGKQAEEVLRDSEDKMRKELQDTQLLQRISNHIIDEADPEVFYDVLLDSAMKLMSADFASIQLLQPQSQELLLLAYKNLHPHSARHWQVVQAGPGSACGQALATGQRVIATNLEHPPFDMDIADYEAFRRSGINSVQSTPLVSRLGTQIGMMSTHWRKPHTPSPRELGLFDIVARQVADLFERDSATAALRISEERYRKLFNSIDEGFQIFELIFDDAGEPYDARYIETNDSFTLHTGLRKVAGKLASEVGGYIDKYWLEFNNAIVKIRGQCLFITEVNR